MSELFTASEQVINVFDVTEGPEHEKLTPFNNEIGFSIQRPYPEGNRFKPPKTKAGKPDTYAIIGIRYEPSKVSADKPKVVPISAKVSVFSRYVSKHWDYDFSDKKCPTEESVIASKKTPKPIDLSAFDEYAYDHDDGVFLDAKGCVIEGMAIIDDLFKSHLATVDKFDGWVFRGKLASRDKAGSFCEILSKFLKRLLSITCGRSLESDKLMRGIWVEYRAEDMKLLKTERIDVFGYKASKNVIVTFCTMLLTGYSLFHWTSMSSTWLKGVTNNSLLSLAFSILLIGFLDQVLPSLFLRAINWLTKLRWSILSKNVAL
jgi:hypothetical protein